MRIYLIIFFEILVYVLQFFTHVKLTLLKRKVRKYGKIKDRILALTVSQT